MVDPGFRRVKRSDAVIRSFAGDDDVVRVGLAQSRGGDLDELGLGAQRLDVAHAAVAHAAAQTTRHLENHVGHGALVRDARFDRSEEHTSELQSPDHLVCRLLLEKKKKNKKKIYKKH